MKTAIAAGVLAAASTAHAQTWQWIATPTGPTDIQPGEIITWTLSAKMTAPEGMDVVGLATTTLDLASMLNGETGHVTHYEILNGLCGAVKCGTVHGDGGHELDDISAFQLVAFGPFTSDNPIDVLEFGWQAPDDDGEFDVEYATATASALIWASEDGGDAVLIEVTDITEASMQWMVVPAPPAALGLFGGLVLAARRRR